MREFSYSILVDYSLTSLVRQSKRLLSPPVGIKLTNFLMWIWTSLLKSLRIRRPSSLALLVSVMSLPASLNKVIGDIYGTYFQFRFIYLTNIVGIFPPASSQS